jgi:two-component system NtrC family response regulator
VSSVLIVDDEPRIREILARWLQPEGYSTREAPDADAALDLMSADVSSVVLCDMRMPGKSGAWLVDQLRVRYPSTAIVIATGDTGVSPAVTLKMGVVDYVVKPFARERVLEAVARAVEWNRAEQARPKQDRPRTEPLEEWIRPPDK